MTTGRREHPLVVGDEELVQRDQFTPHVESNALALALGASTTAGYYDRLRGVVFNRSRRTRPRALASKGLSITAAMRGSCAASARSSPA